MEYLPLRGPRQQWKNRPNRITGGFGTSWHHGQRRAVTAILRIHG